MVQVGEVHGLIRTASLGDGAKAVPGAGLQNAVECGASTADRTLTMVPTKIMATGVNIAEQAPGDGLILNRLLQTSLDGRKEPRGAEISHVAFETILQEAESKRGRIRRWPVLLRQRP